MSRQSLLFLFCFCWLCLAPGLKAFANFEKAASDSACKRWFSPSDSIRWLRLSGKTENHLRAGGIQSLYDLLLKLERLQALPGIEESALAEIHSQLSEIGFVTDYKQIQSLAKDMASQILEGENLLKAEEQKGPFPQNPEPLERGSFKRALAKKENKELQAQDVLLFRKLSNLRSHLAKEKNIPPYKIFENSTLAKMTHSKPKNKQEMLEIIGSHKFDLYGRFFLTALQTSLKKL